jgi:RNA polymerase sigma factor (TIGR02999 family)
MTDVTRLLQAIEQGDPAAAGQLLPRVYDELRRLAAQKLAREEPGQTLDATALVHEAYLRLVGPDGALHFANRRHFFAAAAEAMRRVLVENARRKGTVKHGGGRRRVDLDQVAAPDSSFEDLVSLDEALKRLRAESPARAELVQLRFFAGLTMPQAAEVLGVSLATAERHWAYARAWLYAALRES